MKTGSRNGQQASIITDRCIPPQGLACTPPVLKAVVWALRGLGAPGDTISVPSEIIERRTCLSTRSVRTAIKVLMEERIIEQVSRPAPGRPAEYLVDYMELSKWLDPADRAWVMSDPSAPNACTTRTRSHAPHASDRVHQVHASDSTHAPPAASCAPPAATHAGGAHDIKEETALPAKPAAAAARPETAKNRTAVGAEQQLVNLAAAAAGILGPEAWGGLAAKAGLTGGLLDQCPRLLIERGVQDAETGRRAMERLKERIGRVDNATGFFIAQLEQDGGPDETSGSRSRRERVRDRRRELLDHMDNRWSPGNHAAVAKRVQILLERELGEDVARELMPVGQYAKPIRSWPAMLDFIAARYADLHKVQPEAVPA